MTELTGATLGRYQVLARLGRGGMADVYKGFQPSLDRYVAIKVLHPSMVEDPDFVQRFQREAKSVANLRHPNIVQVFDSDRQGEVYYMVMEFLDGPTLKSALEEVHRRGEEMPLKVALRIVADVGTALAYAHEMGVVHRDVKPANIMLDRTGRVILTDFGVAKMLTGTKMTVTGTVLGTPAYMSPEQGSGQPGDARSDIYSLGVVLYELATGRLPYDADTPLAVLLKHVHDPLPLPRTVNPALPEEVERILLRALAKDPADRYPNVQAMLDDIAGLPPATVPAAQPGALDTRSLAARAPVSVHAAPTPATPPPSTRTTGSRPRGTLWLGGGLLAAVLVCGGIAAVAVLALLLTGTIKWAAAPAATTAPSPATTLTPRPAATSRPTATPLGPPGETLFEDHFDNSGSGWTVYSDSGGGAGYGEGVFRIWVDEANVDKRSTAGQTFTDVRISAMTFKAAGPDDNNFGLICRYQDEENFYSFEISSDGFYAIVKMHDGRRDVLGPEQDAYLSSPAIHTGEAENEIVAICDGDHLALHVNGVLVADERDGAIPFGDVGVLAGSFDEVGVELHFDDFIVHDP